jgi:hypothetical protein
MNATKSGDPGVLYRIIKGEIEAIVASAPAFGSIGVIFTFHQGGIVRVERTCTELTNLSDGP